MDPIRNPFVPGAGTAPPELAGRGEILTAAEVAFARVSEGRAAKSSLLVGLRGVGKTVLLNKMQETADAKNFKTAFIETPENKSLPALLLPHLRRILLSLDRMENLNEHVKYGMRVLKSFANALKIKYGEVEFGPDIDPAIGTADSGDLDTDLAELFLSVGQAARARQTAVALIIDELQYLSENEFGSLIMAIHRVTQKGLPLMLFGAGLPQLVGLAGKAKSYAERLFDYPDVGPLNEPDAINALQEPVQREGVSFSEDALNKILSHTAGYPYFLQEWGFQSWKLAERSPIDLEIVKRATPIAIANLDAGFFRVRMDRLTPRERDYLLAMAELGPGPHRSGDIAKSLRISVRTAGPLRGGLIKKGMVYSPAHGDTAFTVPLFDESIKRSWQWLPNEGEGEADGGNT